MPDKPEEAAPNGDSSKTSPVIAGFRLLKRVGAGGMGTVYRARQLSVNRIVAVKILKPNLARDERFLDRFKAEATAAAALNHPNIVQAIDAGQDGGYFYFAMEYVDGETLHRLMLREGLLEEKPALKIALDVARALGHANLRHIVHRDIKPGNIMLTSERITKLCDLGLARISTEEESSGGRGPAIGTPYYISPEQAQGFVDVDTRSDIYSLGATLFRALAGRPAFDAPTRSEILIKHCQAPLPWPKDHNPDLTDQTCYLIAKMMAKKPEERYQTPDELAEDIERILRGEAPKSAVVELATPPSRLSEEERAASAMTAARLRKKRRAVEQIREVRRLIDNVAAEQAIPPHAVVRLLRGNLDESKPETFLKYGVILLAERRFFSARQEFRRAARLGADVSAYMDKLDALGAPAGMAYVPAGEFVFGPPDAPRNITLTAFYVDLKLVTNRRYGDFMRATGAPAPEHWLTREIPEGLAEFPVVNVSWDDALAFAKWAGRRLLSVEEWQKAARGPDGRRYPWGNDFDRLRCNTSESGIGQLTMAGRYPRGISPYGCFDMIGNVLQWCRDAGVSTEEPDSRPVCGIAFDQEGAASGCWQVERRKKTRHSRRCGFRCAVDV